MMIASVVAVSLDVHSGLKIGNAHDLRWPLIGGCHSADGGRGSWLMTRAADALGLTPSGVGRAIQRLEARIGVRLLDRTTRSLRLTDEGLPLSGAPPTK
jgi:DNA-binding MarR family transcriptional regulator